MIKGHTKIELTNVKTGQKKVIEDTNMITNGMSNFLMANPYNPVALYPSSRPFTTEVPKSYQLCGGLLLFNKPIEEDPDMIFPPAGNKMIGNACAGISSGSAIPEFGYFDANNSTLEYDGDTTTQKFVFDFSTSQGNGEISSVCLASMLAGYMGFGNHSGQRMAENIGNLGFGNTSWNPFKTGYIGHDNTQYYYPKYRLNDEVDMPAFPFLFDYNKNCVYQMAFCGTYYNSRYPDEHWTSGTLKLQKQYFPLSSLNPLHMFNSDNKYYWDCQKYQKYEVEIPSEIIGVNANELRYCHQFFHGYDGTYLIVGTKNSQALEPNDTIYVLHVNADLETKLYTVKNTTGKQIFNVTVNNSTVFYDRMAVKDGYLFCQTYPNGSPYEHEFFKISLTDSTDVASLGNIPANNDQHVRFYLLSDRLFVGTSYDYTYHMIDDVENTILPVNAHFRRDNNGHSAICGCKFMYYSGYGVHEDMEYNRGQLMFNPMYLATINNLSEPVVKTSDLTMKITYTLTCTEEGRQEGDS